MTGVTGQSLGLWYIESPHSHGACGCYDPGGVEQKEVAFKTELMNHVSALFGDYNNRKNNRKNICFILFSVTQQVDGDAH